jgi:hypothetical protein
MNREPMTTESLTVTGPTSLTDTTIAGTLMVGGELTLAGNTINTTTPQKPLEIQSHAQSPVQFMGGLVEFFTDGSIKTEGSIEAGVVKTGGIHLINEDAGQVSGKGVIPKGETDVFVSSERMTENSLVILTRTSREGESLYVKESVPEKGFVVSLKEKSSEEVTFTWFTVEESR